MDEFAEQQTVYMKQDLKFMEIFISATPERNVKPDNNELAAHIHKYQHEFDIGIEVLIMRANLHKKFERELWEDKFICLLGTKTPTAPM